MPLEVRQSDHNRQEGRSVLNTSIDQVVKLQVGQERVLLTSVVQHANDAIVSLSLDGIILHWNAAAERIYGYAATEVVGQPVSMLLPPDQPDEMLRILDKIRRGEQVDHYETERRRKDGRFVTVSLTVSPIKNRSGQIVAASTIARDMTGHKQSERALRKARDELEQRVEERTHEIERRRQVAESLRDILAILNSNRPLTEILDYIVAQASWLLGSDASAVYQLQDKDGLLCIQATRGLEVEQVVGMLIPIGQGITRQAILRREPVVVADTTRQPADLLLNLGEVDLDAKQKAFLAHMADRYAAMLAVPLVVKDKIYGTISLYFHKPTEFYGEEIELATAFADQAALAIENARLRVQVEQAAVTAERDRLARDLHDAVTQTLFSASLIAEMLPRVWERHPGEAQHSLEELRLLTRGALAEMRTLLLELRPASLTESKLAKVLRHLTDAVTSRTRVPVALTVEGDCVLQLDVQVALYRIAQEALNNMAKHARADRAAVELHCRPNLVVLRISDDGQGFEPASVSSDHLGIGIMRERAKAIGAVIEIESRPGCGTRVVITWQDTEREGVR